MTFITVKTPEDHKALVARYLTKKDALKHQLESDRIGEFNLQIDAAKLFKPVTTAVQSVGTDQAAKLQALQESSNTNQQRILQALTNPTGAIQALGTIPPFGEYPMVEAPQAAALQAVPQTTIVDFNKDLNLDLLTRHGLTLPNDLINADSEDLEAMIKYSSNVNNKIGSEQKNPKRPLQDIKQDVDSIKQYRNRLRSLADSRGLVVGTTASTTGKGIIKITPTGQLGRVQIDPTLLRSERLKAYIGGTLALDLP
jgi:hypothetical protein